MSDNAKTPEKKSVNVAGSVPLTDIIYRTLHFWPWLLLSLFVCVGSATVYLLCTPSIYSTSASILIKDNSNSNVVNMGVGGDEFSNMGLFKSKMNIQNEMTTFMSIDLMAEVVKRLHLDMNYYTDGVFHKEIAYGYTLPVSAELIDFPTNDAVNFDLNVDKEGNVKIRNIQEKGEDRVKDTYTGKLNDTISTAIGKIYVAATENYRKDKVVELSVEKESAYLTTADYSKKLTVTLNNKEGSVLDLMITDCSTQRAQDILSTLIGVYNESWISDRNQIAVSTSNFIGDRLAVIENELGSVDSDISSYKSEHLIPDVSAASAMYMSQNQQLSDDIISLNNQLQTTRYVRNYLAADNSNDKMLPIPSGIENVDIQSQLSEYNEKVLQRNSLIDKSSEKNPLVISLDAQLTAQRNTIIATVDNAIVLLQARMKSLQGTQASTTSKIASNPSQAKYLLSVERQQKVKESLYLFLLQKREENELSQAFTAYNTRIIKKPASWGPTAPETAKILLVSVLLGLAIPFGIVFLIETNNTKVRGRKDVENLVIPFLGEIPQYGSTHHKKGKKPEDDVEKPKVKRMVVRDGKRDIINESFRVLRTNVEFMCNSSEPHNSIAITSFNPGSGKSFISINLGMSLAIKENKVLVIDGDMRHGSASAYVGSPERGLSSYLSGTETNVNSLLVQDNECEYLHVLPIGTIPPNPTELLESPRFSKLIQDLKPIYNYIIIDCPPIEVVADAQIIDRYADRTFFVIRAGLFERTMLPELDRLYGDKKYHNMAFILNGTRNEQGRYGYSHSYRYGYGYGYGYGYNYGEGKKK
jgi:capsular exopolysaccharide synthesis family protein